MPQDEEQEKPDQELQEEQKSREKPSEKEAKRRYIKLAGFGLPISPYDTIRTILRAMSKLGGSGTSLTIQQIAEMAMLSPQVVSGNNRFLVSTGILGKSGTNFYLTEKGAQLTLAVDYNDSEDTSRAWRSLISENDFLKKILGALDVKGGMTESEFAQYIAKTAGAPNEPPFVRGGSAIVSILKEAGLVTETESGGLIVTPDYRTLGVMTESGEPSLGMHEEKAVRTPIEAPEIPITKKVVLKEGIQIALNVTLNISHETTPDQIDSIAKRIKELRDKIQ